MFMKEKVDKDLLKIGVLSGYEGNSVIEIRLI